MLCGIVCLFVFFKYILNVCLEVCFSACPCGHMRIRMCEKLCGRFIFGLSACVFVYVKPWRNFHMYVCVCLPPYTHAHVVRYGCMGTYKLYISWRVSMTREAYMWRCVIESSVLRLFCFTVCMCMCVCMFL